jgi:hypothetical protein
MSDNISKNNFTTDDIDIINNFITSNKLIFHLRYISDTKNDAISLMGPTYTFVPHTNYKYYDITLEKHFKTISARIHEIPTPKDSYWFDTEVILRSDNLLKLFERIKKKIDVIE